MASKCISVLLYGLEACPLLKLDKSFLDFTTDRLFMKLFQTSFIEIVRLCQSFLNFELPGVRWDIRVAKFGQKKLNSQLKAYCVNCRPRCGCHNFERFSIAIDVLCYGNSLYCILFISAFVFVYCSFFVFLCPCYHHLVNKDVGLYIIIIIMKSYTKYTNEKYVKNKKENIIIIIIIIIIIQS